MSEVTMNELVNLIPKKLDPNISESINAIVQIVALGEDGGKWSVVIEDNQSFIKEGVIDSPDLIISANTKDLLDIFSGEKDGIQSYMQGKLDFSGGMGLAMKLFKLFSLHRTYQNLKQK